MKITIQDHSDPGAVILDRELVDYLTRGNIIDAPITRIKDDPPVWLLPTAMQQNGDIFLSHTAIRGDITDLENTEYCVISEHSLIKIPERMKDEKIGRHWITNLLTVDGGKLAFLHSEYTGADDYFGMPGEVIDGKEKNAPGRSCISLAWISDDSIKNDEFQFVFLGHIATYSADFPHFNVSGTPVFVNTCDDIDYVNIMFTDMTAKQLDVGWEMEAWYVSQARAPLAEVVRNAKAEQSVQWHKRDGVEWKDAMGAQSSGVLPKVGGHSDQRIRNGQVIVHSDAFYHGASRKFILVGYVLLQKNRNPTSLVLYSSVDGLDWEYEGISNARSDCENGWSYVTIFDDDSEGTEKELYLLSGWDYGKVGRCVYKLNIDIELE